MGFTREEILEDIAECSRLGERRDLSLALLFAEHLRARAREREREEEHRARLRLQIVPVGVLRVTCAECGGEIEHRHGARKPLHLGRRVLGTDVCAASIRS